MAYSKEEIQAFKNEIVEHISNGSSLKNTLESNSHLPTRTTIYTWLNNTHDNYDKTFLNNYTRACEERADSIFDEVIDIADDSSSDTKTLEDGKEVLNGEFVARSRIRIDARKWVLGRMKPKKYGERIQHANDPENPLPTPATAVEVVFKDFSDEEE